MKKTSKLVHEKQTSRFSWGWAALCLLLLCAACQTFGNQGEALVRQTLQPPAASVTPFSPPLSFSNSNTKTPTLPPAAAPSSPTPFKSPTPQPQVCTGDLADCPQLIYFREMLENPDYHTLLALHPPPELADLHYELADRKADLEEIDQQIASARSSGNAQAALGFVQARSMAESAYYAVRERALDAWEAFLSPYNITLPRTFKELHPLTGIAFTNPREGWIVGRKGIILYYDGGSWQRSSSPTQTDLAGLALDSGGQGWAWGVFGDQGASILLRLQGKHWQEVENPASLPVIRSISILSPSLAWMLASDVNGMEAEILHYNGRVWFQEKKLTFKDAISIHMRSLQAGWVDGYAHNQVLLSINGIWQTHTLISAQDCSINQVQLLAADAGWAAGKNGCIFKFDGNHWAIEKTPVMNDMRQLWMINAKDGWAMGQNGSILHYDGRAWVETDSPATETIEVLAGYRAGLGLAMTTSGRILRYDGAKWALEDFPVQLGFSSSPVFLEDGEIWAITPLHGIAHFANGGWEVAYQWPEELP
ncbi:MAG: hypothetical protein IT308_10050 [Anaerolineaceae bacterium]|nr:hypothetical protein [Anaerolineaceae bacterium]